jgi:hypothetical protein
MDPKYFYCINLRSVGFALTDVEKQSPLMLSSSLTSSNSHIFQQATSSTASSTLIHDHTVVNLYSDSDFTVANLYSDSDFIIEDLQATS